MGFMQTKINSSNFFLFFFLFLFVISASSQNINLASDETEVNTNKNTINNTIKSSESVNLKKYCVTNYKGKYEISLLDDGSHKGYFNLYDNNDNLLKTTQGDWILRDEGVYGAAYVLTFEFTGVNSNLPSMKFTCQYNGSGQLQALIDNQDRTWNMCR
jgi:hypothetical protein